MKPLNYGIIGCGMMGREHIRNIKLLEPSKTLAIFEPDAAMRAAASELVPDAIFTHSLDELLDIEALDALVLASPNHLHVGQFEHIAKTRPLPLLMEKPALTQKEDISRLHAAEQNYKAPIWVAMEYRYMPAISKFMSTLHSATGGVDMLSITEHRFPFLEKVDNWNRFNSNSGGSFVEKCCHFFDLMRHILRSEPVCVMALGGQAHNHVEEIYDGNRSDIWDHGYAIVEFASGAKASLDFCMFAEGSPYQETLVAVGHEGKITCEVPGPLRFWPAEKGAAPIAQIHHYPRKAQEPMASETILVDPLLLHAGDHNGATYYQHMKFADAVLGKAPVEVTLQDGIKAASLGLAAQISATEKRTVFMDEFLQS